MQLIDRYRGCLLGLATGDAVGTTLEFEPPGTFTPIKDMVGGGVFALEPGQWTDDTSMMLCLAESLIEQNEFDPTDQLKRYLQWYQVGHLSRTGYVVESLEAGLWAFYHIISYSSVFICGLQSHRIYFWDRFLGDRIFLQPAFDSGVIYLDGSVRNTISNPLVTASILSR